MRCFRREPEAASAFIALVRCPLSNDLHNVSTLAPWSRYLRLRSRCSSFTTVELSGSFMLGGNLYYLRVNGTKWRKNCLGEVEIVLFFFFFFVFWKGRDGEVQVVP